MAYHWGAWRGLGLGFALILLTTLCGCSGIEIHAAVRQTFATPRPISPGTAEAPVASAGNAPLLVVMTYGFGCEGSGPGNGLREVADEIRRRHPEQQVITRAWNDDDAIEDTIRQHAGPVALIGHSFGGSKSVEIATQAGRPIDWLILLDPVPPGDWAVRHSGKYFQLPPGVRNAACFRRSGGGWPTSYPITNPLTPADNRVRSMGHSAFCGDPEVREYVLGVSDKAAAVELQASRAAQKPGSGGQQAADNGHRDQVRDEVRNQHQG